MGESLISEECNPHDAVCKIGWDRLLLMCMQDESIDIKKSVQNSPDDKQHGSAFVETAHQPPSQSLHPSAEEVVLAG